jgi:IclR family transcriptional regulator, KDG regulon repressor
LVSGEHSLLLFLDKFGKLYESIDMSEVKTLARGLMVLEKLAEASDGLSITELAKTFEVDKGGMSRVLQTLSKYGFAEKNERTRKYALGSQIVRLSHTLLNRMEMRETAKPYLQKLVDQSGECAHLAILAKGEALSIDQAETPSALRVTTGVGTLAPLHCTALGKIFLAFTDSSIPEMLQSYTFRTITEPSALRHHVDQIIIQGYALDDEEYNLGVRCIAVPVFDYQDHCIAAIGISGPTSRLPLENIANVVKIVQEIGQTLSAHLSFKTVE